MFTGLIEHCGEIISVEKTTNHALIRVRSLWDSLTLGESISIDGVCLTITDITPEFFICDISPETMRLTISNTYQKGQRVNLERALLVNARLGGHFVSGHIDQVLAVAELKQHESFLEIIFNRVEQSNYAYLIKKGSVAINGVSLTINEVMNDAFSVMLIPHTVKLTNLGALQVGQPVNVEFDLLAKLISKKIKETIE